MQRRVKGTIERKRKIESEKMRREVREESKRV
jgi:hypothetical protein